MIKVNYDEDSWNSFDFKSIAMALSIICLLLVNSFLVIFA